MTTSPSTHIYSMVLQSMFDIHLDPTPGRISHITFSIMISWRLIRFLWQTKARKKKLTTNNSCLGKTQIIGLVCESRTVFAWVWLPNEPDVPWEPFYKWNFKFYFSANISNTFTLSLTFCLSPYNRILAQIFKSLPEKSISETQISFPLYLVLLAWDPHYVIPFVFAALCHFKGHVPPS